MDTQMILSCLKSLSENNNREWYHDHKAEYKEANARFVAEAVRVFQLMKLFNDFLNRALPVNSDGRFQDAFQIKAIYMS